MSIFHNPIDDHFPVAGTPRGIIFDHLDLLSNPGTGEHLTEPEPPPGYPRHHDFHPELKANPKMQNYIPLPDGKHSSLNGPIQPER